MVALVTGSSRGIGRATAIELAKCGFDIAVNYCGNKEKAEETAELCRQHGVRAEVFCADVSDFSACGEMVAAIEKELGFIDVLVNNAGITRDGLLMRMDEEQFDAVYFTNLKSVYNLSKLVISRMMKNRFGRIINISSVAGIYGNAGQVNYSSAKAGVIGFTKALAKEAGSRGITVNAVAPGFIETDMTASLPDSFKEEALSRISLKRFGNAEEIAKTVAFLASEDASYITGQTIEVSGGISL
ncbi:MAG: 3-oxoacyl-(acyl-carrier-protein) reductase FabG [Firmicutes bacterium ADurb.Bin193]|nr:MAG: 3-oxoacyl-(acyl-carrier-protein) reductase FabG [Firmicutes bacterium ADurb.Bin193]